MPRLLHALNRVLLAVVRPPLAQVAKEMLFGHSALGIVVHARCRIGRVARGLANAVVLADVPDDVVVVGIPARNVRRHPIKQTSE